MSDKDIVFHFGFIWLVASTPLLAFIGFKLQRAGWRFIPAMLACLGVSFFLGGIRTLITHLVWGIP